MAFKINIIERDHGTYVATLEGYLDTETCPLFEEKVDPLLTASLRALVIDMSKLNYISSAGIGVILKARKIIEMNKGTFVMTDLQPQIKKVFDIVKVLPREGIFESMEEVDKYLDAVQKRETGEEY